MDEYCTELHKTYQKTIGAFERAYPLADSDLLRQIDNYSQACALYLWSLFDVEPSKCVEAINVIYSGIVGPIGYTEENVRAAMGKLFSRNYSVLVPDFFLDIISYDEENGTDMSSRLVACFQLLDIAYALIDGKFEKEEAHEIEVLQEELLSACRSRGIKPYSSSVNPSHFMQPDINAKLIVTAGGISASKPKKDEAAHKEENQSKSFDKKDIENKPKVEIDIKSGIEDLDKLIGLNNAKKEIYEIADFAKVQKLRMDLGLPTTDVSYHLVFTGNPGTGKTTVARLVAEIYKELGIVSKGHLVEVSAKDLVAGYVGQTAIKTDEIINKSLGGVLFIDEAYTLLDKNDKGYGQEAIDTLLKEMEDKRADFAVIVAGYDDLMQSFINSNPGLKSRFNKYVHFDDYTPEEMYQIFLLLCKKGSYNLSQNAQSMIHNYFASISTSTEDGFANGRTVRNIFEDIISKQAGRIASARNKTIDILSTIEVEDVIGSIGSIDENKEESLEDALREFNSLIGLDGIKEEITELVYIVQNQQRRKAQGLKSPSFSHHLVFMGNPGTGKTTVARSVAKIYKCLGILSKGQLIETDRSGLVAGYVGQTAIKTQEVINSAIGGVLFIDEAYTLSKGGANDFGQEAIDTLLKVMEDQRHDLVVIVAGYDDLMREFIRSNPGLESRFNRYIHFEDYSSEQMYLIFSDLCFRHQYELSEDAKEKLRQYFEGVDTSTFGNGRGVRNLFENVVIQQAKRIEKSATDTDIQLIGKEDIISAIMKG